MKEKPSPPAKAKSKIREFIEAVLTAFLIAAFIISFVVQAFKIPSGSMIPTLLVGDHLFRQQIHLRRKNSVFQENHHSRH